jgi:hypothetical protein
MVLGRTILSLVAMTPFKRVYILTDPGQSFPQHHARREIYSERKAWKEGEGCRKNIAH